MTRRRIRRSICVAVACTLLFLVGCGAPPNGHDGHGAQNLTPVEQIHAHVCGFHFYSGQMNRQIEAHHYCSHVSDELLQCVIYDGDGKDAKLIGIEYIISERLFNTLSNEEKKLWHSHRFEVKGGLLTAPGLSEAAEHALMKDLAATYGKTFHTWQVDRGDKLPLGVPQLMMAFVAPGQMQADLLRQRERNSGVDAEELIRQRADIPDPDVAPGADAWIKSPALQLRALEVESSPATAPKAE